MGLKVAETLTAENLVPAMKIGSPSLRPDEDIISNSGPDEDTVRFIGAHENGHYWMGTAGEDVCPIAGADAGEGAEPVTFLASCTDLAVFNASGARVYLSGQDVDSIRAHLIPRDADGRSITESGRAGDNA